MEEMGTDKKKIRTGNMDTINASLIKTLTVGASAASLVPFIVNAIIASMTLVTVKVKR